MVSTIEKHHIDFDRANNTPSNLFKTDMHKILHDQIRYIFNEWELSICKTLRDRDLVKYFLRTGELVIEGGVLQEYEKTLNSLNIWPPYIMPDPNIALLLRKIKLVPLARSELELAILEKRMPVRNATLHTTTKSTLEEERRGED